MEARPALSAPFVPDDLVATVVAPALSFDDLFQREWAPMVRLAAAAVGTAGRAEELVQDAFERTYLRWSRLDQPGAYLHRAVVNGCHSELRRRRVLRRREPLLVRPTAVVEPPGDELTEALATLSPRRRLALVLRFYGDWPEGEIAEALGVRPATVRSLVKRGLEDLRKVVER